MADRTDGHSAKRQKLEDGSSLPITDPDNPYYSPPSKVVHVRGVAEGARDFDIRAISQRIRSNKVRNFLPCVDTCRFSSLVIVVLRLTGFARRRCW